MPQIVLQPDTKASQNNSLPKTTPLVKTLKYNILNTFQIHESMVS